MNKELKQQIIETMQSIHGQIGETVIIDDWISTNGRNYDRHQTRYSKVVLKIVDFSIRTSGSIAAIKSTTQQVEFRSDSIKEISNKEDELIMEINMANNIWRRIKISKLKKGDCSINCGKK